MDILIEPLQTLHTHDDIIDAWIQWGSKIGEFMVP